MLQNAAPALVLLIVMVCIAWALQRYRRHLPGAARQTGPALQVLSTLALGPQQRVVTVQVGQGEGSVCLVLGVSAGSVTPLHSLPMPAPADEPATHALPLGGFAAKLAQFRKAPDATQ